MSSVGSIWKTHCEEEASNGTTGPIHELNDVVFAWQPGNALDAAPRQCGFFWTDEDKLQFSSALMKNPPEVVIINF
ncbi:hypothetical protein OIU76_018686 [Salix suchowensis]|nr:hypothetical protein OIU76_018686 [Salix suchowensis]